MYCTHKECPENQLGIICTKEMVSGVFLCCSIRDMLDCCKDCGYECKTSFADEVPTGCGVADAELRGEK